MIARQQGRGLSEAQDIGVDIVASSSLKAALDLNWDDPDQKNLALGIVLDALEKFETFVQTQSDKTQHPQVQRALETARQIEAQDVEVDADGEIKLLSGVAKERRISIEDDEMRHGRKSKNQRFDGYKRHVLRDLDSGLVRAVGITRANIPEASVTDAIASDLKLQQVNLVELHIDSVRLSPAF